MIQQLNSEFRKALTLRSTPWLMLALVVGGAGMCAILSTAAVGAMSPIDIESARGVTLLYNLPVAMGAVVPLALGVTIVTAEHQHRTTILTYLGGPRRWRIYLSKLVVSAAGGATMAVAAMATAAGVVAVVLYRATGRTYLSDGLVQRTLLGSVLAIVLWAVIGTGLGAAIANQTLAIVGVLGFTVFLEPFLRIIAGTRFADVAQLLPGSASDALASGSILSAALDVSASSQGRGGLILAGYALVFSLVGYARTRASEF